MKADLIRKIAGNTGIHIKDVDMVYERLMDEFYAQLLNGESIILKGVGKIESKPQPPGLNNLGQQKAPYRYSFFPCRKLKTNNRSNERRTDDWDVLKGIVKK